MGMSFTSGLQHPQELRETIRQLSRLAEISAILNSTLDPERLLQFIIETAADLLGCEAASILLYDDDARKLIFAAATGSDPAELAQIPVPIESSVAGEIFTSGKPLMINDARQDPRLFRQVGDKVKLQTRSLLGVPMRLRGQQTVGVLEALNKHKGDFSPTDVQLLDVIAAQAAVAIHNARLVQQLQQAYAALKEADKLKTDFMAIASHELRTPLGVILGYATFLKEDAQGDLSEHAEMVLNSALKLRTLVEDMTNLSMLQMGKAQLRAARLALQPLMMNVYREIQATAEAKNQIVRLQMPSETLYINGDAEKLRLVFGNLLNNAVRFTPAGGSITVRAGKVRDKIGIEVTDNGTGIEPQMLERIFEQFYQVENHLTRKHGGMGLGLAIAKGVVELHNGKIWAESPGLGKGASFKLLLPASE
ncbi:MAG: hypothetical protein OHK0052_09710 [Anaerolineales bacterium]